MATRRAPPASSSTRNIKPPSSSTRLQQYRQPLVPHSSETDLAQPEGISPSTTINALPPLSFASPRKPSPLGSQERVDSEMNVQVFVRCRIRSEREMTDNSPIIVSTQGARSQEITIETALPTSTLGIDNPPPTRTYPFDRVFGPEADQGMIYMDVVHPILDQVLAGYNCTLFAYGQTGTGKTYTMQGDLTPSITGGPCADAGMIPRALAKLYQYLETSVVDYTVKISYVELYNEELRDLLAPELSAPAGTAQPMGLANNANTNALKIFDEAGGGKRGVLIQGLEEVSCKDANHAIAILRKGSLRRQIAATKFNDHSSRSHSIFMVTVHTKETNSKGDDTLRVGKLNLVDLAGSENIGRSGAENKRAREAGMINQSLLTLGRVINALVDGSPHIPYRESKLTRLLQDSLGGRTKTCIIATVSPARCNMEETLSTLDYALRAKSIRNKPEVNQRMTRNSLLKEYVVEIEKLKSDLLAAREKNGIWFSKESWAEMSDEKEQMRTLYEESRRQVEIIQSQMRAVREEFESAMGLLTRSENELRGAKERLEKTEGSLRETEREREGLKGMLEEEVVVREAHELAERRLDEVARSLREVATEGVKDVGGLFNKLDRKTAVFSSNAKAVVKHSTALDIRTLQLQETLQEFAKDHRLTTQELVSMADRIRAHELEVLAQHSAAISKQLASLDQAIPGIRTKEAAETEATTAMSQVVRKATDGIMTSLSQWETQVKQNCDALVEEVGRGCLAQMDVAAHVLGSAITLVRDVVRESKEFVESERKTMEEILQLSVDASQAEISRLTNQNTLLTRLLDSEKVKAEGMRDELIKQVSTLLVGFTDARDASMREAINAVRSDIVEGQDHMRAFGERTGVVEEDVEGRLARAEDVLEERLRDGEKLRDGGMKALSSAKTIVTSELTAWQTGMASQATKQASAVKNHAQMLSSGHTAALERLDRCKRARIEVATSLEGEVREGLGSLREGILGTSKRIEEGMEGVSEEVSNLGHFAEELSGSGVATVGQIRDIAGRLMVEGTKEDVPTGATPRKRQWEVVDEWEVTEGREEVLRKWRSVRQRGEEHKGEVDKMADENAPMDVDPVGGAPDEEVEDGASTSCATAVEAAPTPPPVRLPIAEIVKPSTRRMKPPTKTGRTGGVKTRSGMPLVEKPTNVPPPMTTNGKGLMTRRTLR